MFNEEQFLSRYICLFCMNLAQDPMETNCCGKFLYRQCYNAVKKKMKKCPQKCKGRFLAHASINAKRDIKEMRLPCKKGCGESILLSDKEKHQELCLYSRKQQVLKKQKKQKKNNPTLLQSPFVNPFAQKQQICHCIKTISKQEAQKSVVVSQNIGFFGAISRIMFCIKNEYQAYMTQ